MLGCLTPPQKAPHGYTFGGLLLLVFLSPFLMCWLRFFHAVQRDILLQGTTWLIYNCTLPPPIITTFYLDAVFQFSKCIHMPYLIKFVFLISFGMSNQITHNSNMLRWVKVIRLRLRAWGSEIKCLSLSAKMGQTFSAHSVILSIIHLIQMYWAPAGPHSILSAGVMRVIKLWFLPLRSSKASREINMSTDYCRENRWAA